MDIILTILRQISRNFIIVLIVLISLFYCRLGGAMENLDDVLKWDRDAGIIGEKKTIYTDYDNFAVKIYRDVKKGTTVTPKVINGIAYFGLNGGLGYTFNLNCLDWRYNIKAHWSSPDVKEERTGFSVNLESPDKKTFISTKEIDIPARPPLSTPTKQNQYDTIQLKGYIEDPFVGDERILAAQQTIRWILDKELDTYRVRGDSIEFTSEQIGNYVFVKTEVELFFKNEEIIKKCMIWALNFRGARLKNNENVRWMETWICQIISDSLNYASNIVKAHVILETFKFDSGRNIYPDLKL